MSDDVRRLLREIVRCPVVAKVFGGNAHHPCAAVVRCQTVSRLEDVQVPEPWTGDLEQAPILFIGSNPNLSLTSVHPLWSWPPDEAESHFVGRFDNGLVADGMRYRTIDGGWSRPVPTWAAQKAIASELLGRMAAPGRDYALTNVVHCKSAGEVGVASARDHCADRYLDDVLLASSARVLVVLGSVAARALSGRLPVPVNAPGVSIGVMGGRRRALLRLVHPGARGAKQPLAEALGASLDVVRAVLLDGAGDSNGAGAEPALMTSIALSVRPRPSRGPGSASPPRAGSQARVVPGSLSTEPRFLAAVRDGCGAERQALALAKNAPKAHYVRVGKWWVVAVEAGRDVIRVEVLMDAKDQSVNEALYESLLSSAGLLRRGVPGLMFDPPLQKARRKAGAELGPIPDLSTPAGMAEAVRTTVARLVALYDVTAPFLP